MLLAAKLKPVLVAVSTLDCDFHWCMRVCVCLQSCISPLKTCTIHDGYYTESLVCFVIGFIWLYLRSSKVRRLQDLPSLSWAVSRRS